MDLTTVVRVIDNWTIDDRLQLTSSNGRCGEKYNPLTYAVATSFPPRYDRIMLFRESLMLRIRRPPKN